MKHYFATMKNTSEINYCYVSPKLLTVFNALPVLATFHHFLMVITYRALRKFSLKI